MKRKKIITILFCTLLILLLIVTIPYTMRYLHWYSKSQGYSELYELENIYSFKAIPNKLATNIDWVKIAEDEKNDGDLPNWPDAKELSVLNINDTIWIKFSLYNNININEPMVSLAIEEKEGGKNWYGSVKKFDYGAIIAAGYVRKADKYSGYNFIQDKKGVCKLYYQLSSNSLFLGIPRLHLEYYQNKRFVASVGQKALWNDDFDKILQVNDLFIKSKLE